ncbi:hypothetical protein [Lysinibacillus pakistanensis]|uniref:hypothetical protein n=1 Tax=Lysinibacillus pakistanensis TaxID=759811 RepID=UPI003D2C05DF
MFTSTESMKKQATNLINTLIIIRGNLVRSLPYIDNNKTVAIYFMGNAYSEFTLFKSIYLSGTPENPQITEFIEKYSEFQNEVDNYVELYEEDSYLPSSFKEIYGIINDLEVNLSEWVKNN